MSVSIVLLISQQFEIQSVKYGLKVSIQTGTPLLLLGLVHLDSSQVGNIAFHLCCIWNHETKSHN